MFFVGPVSYIIVPVFKAVSALRLLSSTNHNYLILQGEKEEKVKMLKK